MQNASISFYLNSFHQPPHLPRAQTRHFGRLLLTDPLLQGLTNQVESLGSKLLLCLESGLDLIQSLAIVNR